MRNQYPNDIYKKFVTYDEVKYWADRYLRKNKMKRYYITIINHQTHKMISPQEVENIIYNNGYESYRNTYNFKSFVNNLATFYLTIKGLSIILQVRFIPKSTEVVNGYYVEPDGQLRFAF